VQDLCQTALQVSPCPFTSLLGSPGLPTLEGAERALRLLAAACMPLCSRWLLDNHFNLSQHLTEQLKSQGIAVETVSFYEIFIMLALC